MKMGNLNLSLKSKGKPFETTSVTSIYKIKIVEDIFKFPTLEVEYSSLSPLEILNNDEYTLDVGLKVGGVTGCPFTPLQVSTHGFKGILVKSSDYSERLSEAYTGSVSDIISSLNVRTSVTGVGSISTDGYILRLNETKVELLSRLLDMSGEGKLWSVTLDKIVVFDSEPSNPKEVMTLGTTNSDLELTRTRSSSTNFMSSSNSERFNYYFGRSTVPVPKLSGYPVSLVSSYLDKLKFKNGWLNSKVSMKSPNELNISVGDTVKFSNISGNQIFVCVKRESILERNDCSFVYWFANSGSWRF